MVFGCDDDIIPGRTILRFLIIIFELRLLSGFSREAICTRIPGLSPRQKHMCIDQPDAIITLSHASQLSAAECQHQFGGERWNCSEAWKYDTFGHVMPIASREAAVVYALTSAAGVYSIAAGCSRGNISICGCFRHPHVHRDQPWKWGGCSVDVGFAIRYAKKFYDAREIERDGRSAMNLHNNNVGRKIVAKLLKKDCLCHGVSGSCSLKTCWRTLPTFREIGAALRKKYDKARLVGESISPVGGMRSFTLLKKRKALKKKQQRAASKAPASTQPPPRASPKPMELIYLKPSPNYCQHDPHAGSPGTVGRKCHNDQLGVSSRSSSAAPGSCHLLCCGRGFTTKLINNNWQCRCKFEWAKMAVKCDVCRNRYEEYFCK